MGLLWAARVAENPPMAHGRAPGHHRPRMETAHWAAAATVGGVVLTFATSDRTYLFTAVGVFGAGFLLLAAAPTPGRGGFPVRRSRDDMRPVSAAGWSIGSATVARPDI